MRHAHSIDDRCISSSSDLRVSGSRGTRRRRSGGEGRKVDESAVGVERGTADARACEAQVATKADGIHLMDGERTGSLKEVLGDFRQ